jgi:hypothetical protein
VNFIRPSTFNIIINYNANISNGHLLRRLFAIIGAEQPMGDA